MSDLASRIAEVTRNDKLGQSETATRLWAVDPILEDLGWRLRDPDEVVPEYPVRGGIVDYCLRSNGRNLVLLEAKRAGSDLTGHQEQLLGYAFAEHAPLAALTNGIQWWLYLPRADGDWEQRRFFSLDLRSGSVPSRRTPRTLPRQGQRGRRRRCRGGASGVRQPGNATGACGQRWKWRGGECWVTPKACSSISSRTPSRRRLVTVRNTRRSTSSCSARCVRKPLRRQRLPRRLRQTS